MPHIQARVPGRWAQAHCLDQRAARVPSAAHSLGGCSQSASEGRVAEDTPSLFMQITGELQPIVTGLSIKNRNSDGLKSPGPEEGYLHCLLLEVLCPQPTKRARIRKDLLFTAGRRCHQVGDQSA